jgi:hypothetical protein
MTHEIKFRIPECELNSVDANFEVFEDDVKIGTLHVSKGSVDWRPKGPSNWYCMDWAKFGELMKANGNPKSPR